MSIEWQDQVDKQVERLHQMTAISHVTLSHFQKNTRCKDANEILNYLEENQERLKIKIRRVKLCPHCIIQVGEGQENCWACGYEFENENDFLYEEHIILNRG